MRTKVQLLIPLIFCVHWLQAQTWSLQQCVDYAIEHNLNIQQAQIQNQLLDNNIAFNKNEKLPDLAAFLNNQFILGVSNVPITNSNQVIVGTESKGYQQYQNSLGLNSNITLYNGGRIKKNVEKSEIDKTIGDFDLQDAKNDLSLNIANAYLTILLNKELLVVAEEQRKVSEDQLKRGRILFEAGSSAKSELVELESRLAQNIQSEASAKIDVEQAKFNLALLLQLEDYRGFNVKEINYGDDLNHGLYDLQEVIDFALQNQPQIKSAEMQEESANLDIEIAETAYLPTIRGSYQLSTFYNQFLDNNPAADPFFRQWYENHTHTFGVGVSIPIFNRYQTDLSVERAQINVEAAKANTAIQRQSIKQDIQQAYFNMEAAYAQYVASKEAVRTSEISLNFAERSLNAGRITIYDYNQNQLNYALAQSQLIQAKYNYLFTQKVLDFYAGRPLSL